MHDTKRMKFGLSLLLGCAVYLCGTEIRVSAQESSDTKQSATKVVRDSGRDPFKKYEPARVVIKKGGLVLPPSIEERIEQYKAQKLAAMNARMPAPKPTTAFLLRELQVVGISHTPRGYAAIVEASPIKLTYVIYPGERFYDGQLVAIEDNRLVFRRETVFADGRREHSVELKALRRPSQVNSMSSGQTASANAPAADSEKKAEVKPATTEKP